MTETTRTKRGPRAVVVPDSESRVNAQISYLNRAGAGAAGLAMQTYTASYFSAEPDADFKRGLAAELVRRFPNSNPLWTYLAASASSVAHLL